MGPWGRAYVYLEATGHTPYKTAYLTSPVGQFGAVSFKYHMYGADMGHLAVEYKNTSGSWIEVWRRSGQQHISLFSDWSEAFVPFYVDLQQVRFVGVTGSAYASDAAVADVYLRLTTGGLNSLLQAASAHVRASSRKSTFSMEHSHPAAKATLQKRPTHNLSILEDI